MRRAPGRHRHRDLHLAEAQAGVLPPVVHVDDVRAERGHLAQQLVGPEEGPAVAGETLEWIAGALPPDYPWPGNVRELGQCLRNVLVRGEYHPRWQVGGAVERLAAEVTAASLTSDRNSER